MTDFVISPEGYEPHPEGLGCCLFESLSQHQEKIIQIDIDNGETDTANALLLRSIRTAIHMKNLGIKSGDVISIYSHNQMNCASAFVAATFLGAVNASLDPKLAEDDVELLVAQVSPKLVFVSSAYEDAIQRVLDKLQIGAKIVVFGESKQNLNYSSFIAPNEEENNFKPWVPTDLNDTIIILFSSGTTGLAKGICWNHKFALFNTRIRFADTCLFINTIYWVGPILLLLSALRHGTTKVFSKSVNFKEIWHHIETYHINQLYLAPYLAMQFLENHPETLVSSLQILVIAGGGTTLENVKKIEAVMPNTKVVIPYGQTETSFVMDFKLASREKFPSVGSPYPHMSCKVVDVLTGETLGPNQRGELRVKSKYMCNGYYKKDSSEIWDDEGYLKTGDIFYYDEDMHFYVVDRVKEMFKFRGQHVTPVKYENILLGHADIVAAAVVGVPHPIEENHICVVVQLTNGRKLSAEDVEQYYNERVDDLFKIRAGVVFVDEMPLTPTGKLKRREIKEMILKNMGCSSSK